MTYLKEERECDPLVVLPVAAGGGARPPHPGVGPCLPCYCERGVDPAVRVQNVFWYILSVDAVYRIPHVLPRRHYQTERDQQYNRNRIVQSEYWRVDLYIVHLYKIL